MIRSTYVLLINISPPNNCNVLLWNIADYERSVPLFEICSDFFIYIFFYIILNLITNFFTANILCDTFLHDTTNINFCTDNYALYMFNTKHIIFYCIFVTKLDLILLNFYKLKCYLSNIQDTRSKIFYFPIMESSTEQNNHLQNKEHKIHIWFVIIKCNLKTY